MSALSDAFWKRGATARKLRRRGKQLLDIVGIPFGLLKPLMPRALLPRSILIMLVPLLLVQATAMYVFYDRHYKRVASSLAQAVAGDIAALVFMVERTQTPDQRAEIFAMARSTMRLIPQYDEFDLPEGLPRVGFRPGVIERRLSNAFYDKGWRYAIDTRSVAGEAIVAVNLPNTEGSLIVRVDKARLFTSTTYIFASWMVGGAIILFGVATIFMRNQVRPIRRLAKAAESYGRGGQIDHIPLQGATEVRQAAASFNQMQDRLQRFLEQRTHMLSGVSHDLRTPLTRMKLQLAMLPSGEDREALEGDIRDMERMVDSYLAFARGEGTEQATTMDLRQTISQVVEDCSRLGQDVPLTIIADDLSFYGKPEAIKRCLTNLVTNGQKYGGRASVTVERRPGKNIDIHVDDAGAGIAKQNRDQVFQPFFRLDASRNSATGGMGLGLAIARDIAKNHGGDIILGDAPSGGLRATLQLPG